MRIKEVEDIVGITKKNIRYYEQEGLLTPRRNAENSYREYSDEDVERLKRVKLLRKLGMPISEIRQVLEKSISLPVAANRHIAALDGQIESLEKARVVCRELSDIGLGCDALDVDEYLSRMEEMEREGVIFMNIQSSDVRKRYAGAAAACAVIVLLAIAAICGFVYMYNSFKGTVDEMPAAVLVAVITYFALMALGTVVALVSRIKELRKGETNDLGKY